MRRLRNLHRYLAVILVALALAGCEENSVSTDPAPAIPPGPGVTAIYGINAQVSYPGEPGSLAEEAMVYVFLRKPGTRMPLVVQHFSASELPKRISFTSATQEEVFELVARLSLSGRVDRSPEDIEITQVVPGFGHPPKSYAMVLGMTPEEGGPGSDRAIGAADIASAEVVGETRQVVIRASVDIETSHPFPPNTVVFVIAREPGQAMPSVVKRLSLADLPARIELTDADAMTFNSRLSYSEQLDLFARISTTGTATQSSADWVSETVHLETARLPEMVSLTISRP